MRGVEMKLVNNLVLQPIGFAEAKLFIQSHHRHHLPPQGWKFGIGLESDGLLIGVVTVGRPVSRALDDGYTAEVTRCCTDGTPNAPSKLYAAARRACLAMGYRKIITYTLDSEPGTSLRASGWLKVAKTKGGSWDTPSRKRLDKHPVEPKVRWETNL